MSLSEISSDFLCPQDWNLAMIPATSQLGMRLKSSSGNASVVAFGTFSLPRRELEDDMVPLRKLHDNDRTTPSWQRSRQIEKAVMLAQSRGTFHELLRKIS